MGQVNPITTPVQIRFRSDDWHIAQMRQKNTAWANWMGCERSVFEATPLSVIGDIWRIHWWSEKGDGPIAGYAICCPACGDVHHWTSAGNCAGRKERGSCEHMGISSCWTWTGSAEDGKMSAHPSLLCHTCNYHGWLKDGVLTAC